MNNKHRNRSEHKKNVKCTKVLLWLVAVILAVINIILFNASMGNISISLFEKNNLDWRDINFIYYICATVDILIFAWLVIMYQRARRIVCLLISEIFCIAQILLLMWKIKL